MVKLLRGIDRFSEWMGKGVMWLTTAMVLITVYNVFSRYVLNNTITALTELDWHFYALIFLLGSGYTLRHDGHVRIDLFYHRFDARRRAWVNLLGTIFFLIPFAVVIIYFLLFSPTFENSFVVRSWRFGEGSPDPGGLPARYLLKSAVVVGFVVLIIQGLGEILRNVLFLKSKLDAKDE